MPDESQSQGVGALRRSYAESLAAPQVAQMDMAKLISDARHSLNQGGQVASFLEGIGLRNATLFLDHEGRRSAWMLQTADFGIRRSGGRGTLTGEAAVLSQRASWNLSFTGEDDGTRDTLTLDVRLRDFVPESIAPLVPELGPIAHLTTPVSGDIKLNIGRSGGLQSASAQLMLKEGMITAPGSAPLGIDSGALSISYAGQGGGIKVQAATVRWGHSHIKVAGEAWPVATAEGAAWRFGMGLVEGALAAPDFGVKSMPVERFELTGQIEREGAALRVRRLLFGAGGGEFELKGDFKSDAKVLQHDLTGSVKNLGAPTLKAIFPRAVNPAFRKWLGEQVLGGRLRGGTFSYEGPGPAGDGKSGMRLNAVFEGEGMRVEPEPGAPPVEMERTLIRVNGDSLEVVSPQAQVLLPSGANLSIKQLRLISSDMWSTRAVGTLSFRMSGSLKDSLELLEQDAFGGENPLARQRESIKGNVNSQFSVLLPLGEDLGRDELKVRGEGKISDGEMRGLLGRYNVQGAAVDFSLSERNAEARGKFLLSGVPVELGWQRIHGAQDHEQPPLRLTATLDNGDRAQLGIDTGGILHGETAVELLVNARQDGSQKTLVTADLSKSEIRFKSLAWRKAPGEAATATLEVVPYGKDSYLLKDFKVAGADLAINGEVNVNAKRGVYAFRFPHFALNLVSQLDASGKLSSKGVWNVKVKGRNFDGRDFYRSLFSVGAPDDQGQRKKVVEADLDLAVEIGNVVGFGNVAMRGLDFNLSRRSGLLSAVQARGIVDANGGGAGQPLDVRITTDKRGRRRLVANSDDAGQLFRMVGFYPNMQGGKMLLGVNLDRSGDAEKTGQLFVRGFRIFGDQIVSEVLQAPDESGRRRKTRVVREVLDFDWMRVPFSVGHGQFVMHGADLRGPLLGVTLKGKADYRSSTVNLGGVYVPLQGLNSMFKDIPLLGQILSGPNGEGILGVTFAIKGPMQSPQVLVNPLSMVAPGIFREMFQMTPEAPRVTPTDASRANGDGGGRKRFRPRSSAAPAVKRDGGGAGPQIDSDGGWVSQPVQKE
jgi:hypothetical protein